jgi:hypothetical protein
MQSTLKGKPKNKVAWPRVNTRVFPHQAEYVKLQVEKSAGAVSEGEVYRQLIDLGIKSKKK